MPPLQVQQAKAQQAQREVERLQRSLSARDALIQQLKTQRANDTPAREVGTSANACCWWQGSRFVRSMGKCA